MCDGGVMVSIVAFQAVDPSSILGHRIDHFLLLVFLCDQKLASDSSGLSGGFRGIGRGFGL
jgi:hypothetical protein